MILWFDPGLGSNKIKMKILRIGSTGSDIKRLQEYLGLVPDCNFGQSTLDSVKHFQAKNNLEPDGIVGKDTWLNLYLKYRKPSDNVTYQDYDFMSYYLGCDISSLKAVQFVETGGKSGFIEPEKPTILFEGHIFWQRLKFYGINPENYSRLYPKIVYPKWTKAFYLGGVQEYSRLSQAEKINKAAALESASWGMFQVMGMNYKLCDCKNVFEFVDLMKKSQFNQLLLSVKLIYSIPKMRNALSSRNWPLFARLYNGPGYKKNNYDIKLKEAYDTEKRKRV